MTRTNHLKGNNVDDMDIPQLLDYLKQLEANNNRVWFQEHKADYEAARTCFDEFLATAIARIAVFDPGVAWLRPKDCTYRIYRDVRFSADKSPYKDHIGGYINARGKKSDHCGYYIHLQPGHCMLAGGSWCMPPQLLKAVRQSVCDHIEAYRAIVEDPAFKHYFPVVGETFLKTMPKGFPKDFPYPQYLRCKDFTVACHVPDSFFARPDCMDRMMDAFRQLKRFADFTNETIDEFE